MVQKLPPTKTAPPPIWKYIVEKGASLDRSPQGRPKSNIVMQNIYTLCSIIVKNPSVYLQATHPKTQTKHHMSKKKRSSPLFFITKLPTPKQDFAFLLDITSQPMLLFPFSFPQYLPTRNSSLTFLTSLPLRKNSKYGKISIGKLHKREWSKSKPYFLPFQMKPPQQFPK